MEQQQTLMENAQTKANILLTLRQRDLRFACAMLLLLTTATVCSIVWLRLTDGGLTSTRLSMPRETSAKFRVNINQATSAEIANLPHVGPSLAQAIVEYRERRGPFASPEELTNVSGVGDKKLAAIAPFLLPL